MRKTVARIAAGAAAGAVAVGLFCYCLIDVATRPQGMGGGMAGMGHELDRVLAGAGGALVGLVGGGVLAHRLVRRPSD